MQLVPQWQKSLWMSMIARNYSIWALRLTVRMRIPFQMTWEQLSNWSHTPIADLQWLNKGLLKFEYLRENTPVIIPGKALNVSYSEDGLKWTINKYGKSLYHEDAYLCRNTDRLLFKGKSLARRGDVCVLPFIPKDHIVGTIMDHDAQKAEYLWCNKALHLLSGEERDKSIEQDKQSHRDAGKSAA